MADIAAIEDQHGIEDAIADFHDVMYRMADNLEHGLIEEAVSEFNTMRAYMEEFRVYLTTKTKDN